VSRRSSVNNRHGVRGLSIVAAAVILIVALGAVFIARDQGQGNGSSNVSLRPNPNTKPILMNWRLVSSVSPGVHPFVSTGGNPQGLSSLTCPSTQVCYLIAGTISGVRNAADRSIDGGMTWSPLTLPAGVLLDTSFSCVSDAECMIGAHDGFGTAVGGSNVPSYSSPRRMEGQRGPPNKCPCHRSPESIPPSTRQSYIFRAVSMTCTALPQQRASPLERRRPINRPSRPTQSPRIPLNPKRTHSIRFPKQWRCERTMGKNVEHVCIPLEYDAEWRPRLVQ